MSGSWTIVDIAGKRADVYEPLIGRAQFAILHLHGADMTTLRDRPAFTRFLDEFHLPCVCPHGQAFWWADRVCPHFDPQVSPERYLLESVLPFFKQKWGLNPPAVGLQGIGMGGQGALRARIQTSEALSRRRRHRAGVGVPSPLRLGHGS